MPSIRIERPRGPRVHYAPLLIAGVVLVALLVFGKMATSRFQWWKDAAFQGRIVAKHAILRSSGLAVEASAALKNPARCRFFLELEADAKTRAQEVIPVVFRDSRVGDLIIKRAGSYKAQWVPAQPTGPTSENAAEGQTP